MRLSIGVIVILFYKPKAFRYCHTTFIDMNHCKNCGNALTGKFCTHCGQKAKVDRITFSYLWHELFHFISHIESGFLFTSLQMLKAPGITAKNFIDGKKKKIPATHLVFHNLDYHIYPHSLFNRKNIWRKCRHQLQGIFRAWCNHKVCYQPSRPCIDNSYSFSGTISFFTRHPKKVQLF